MLRPTTCLVVLLATPLACAPEDATSDGTSSSVEAITAVCVDRGTRPPEGSLVCGGARTVECTSPRGALVRAVYVTPPTRACADVTLTPTHRRDVWFPVGTHDVEVLATPRSGGERRFEGEVCTATLRVVDTQVPVVRGARVVALWPPNHQFHRVTPRDCADVADACDPRVRVSFTWVAGDEPADATGDGHTSPDVRGFGCDGVELLAERRGNRDGRVYTLGFRAVDASGNATEGTCRVVVAHDQSGRAPVESPVAWRLAAPAACRR